MKPSKIRTPEDLAKSIALHLASGQCVYVALTLNVRVDRTATFGQIYSLVANDDDDETLPDRLKHVYADSLSQCYEKFLSQILPHMRIE